MNIIDIAIAKQLAGGGGGSGTDSYNDLSNLPKINDVTLSGNKSSSALGLQSEITSDSKLASDLVDDTNQDNKFVTSAEKTTWNGKQNAIDADHKINADYVDDSTSTNKFVTASDKETWNAKQNAIDNSHKLSSDLVDDANHTNKFVTSTEKQTWNAKQNAIDADHKLSSSLVSFTTAEAAALASGIDSAKVGQISTNQTNILSVQEADGQKNFFPYFKLTCGDSSKLSFNEDGTITSTITSDSRYWQYANREFEMTFKPGDYVVKLYYDNNVSPSINQLALISSNDQLKICGSGNNWELELHVDATVTYGIMVKALTTSGSAPTVFRVMVCTKSQFDISSAYQPYALPNYDLTRLEAEDRASLAEVVDSGAKNLIAPNPVTYPYRGMTLTYSENGIQVTGTASENPYSYIHVGTITITAGMTYVLYDPSYTNSNTAYFYVDSATAFYVATPGIGAEPQYLVAKNSGTYNIYLRSPYNVAVNKLYKPMICTLADWKVSQKYVPYRMPYSQAVTLLNQKAPSGVADYVASGSVDNLPSGCALCGPNVTGKPISDNYFIIRTRIYDSNCAEQEAVAPAGNRRFNRTKWGGTWTSWEEYTLKS